MAAETRTGRCKFSDVIDTEFVIYANNDRGRGQQPQLVFGQIICHTLILFSQVLGGNINNNFVE
jgi:hypothetical protein